MLRSLAFSILLTLPVAALQVGPETPASTTAIETPPGLRGTPRVASNGTDFLVAWYDQRGGAREVHATRVDRNGALVDDESILIGGDATGQLSVASDGHNYLVAYNCHPSEPRLCVARIDAQSGAVEHAPSLQGVNPSLASDGNGYLLVYQTDLHTGVTRARALRGDGVAAGESFAIGTSSFAPSVAANDNDYFVVWSTYAHLEGVLVSDSGVIGTQQRFTTPASFGPALFTWTVASNGDDFFVAWQQNIGVVGTEYTTELRASRVSASGVASAAKKIAGSNEWHPHAVWTGGDYLVTYTHSTSSIIAPYLLYDATADIRAITVSADGDVAGGETNLASESSRELLSAAASNGGTTLVAWANEHRRDFARIESSLVPRGSAPAAKRVISKSAAWQQNVVAGKGGGHLERHMAWEEVAGDAQLSKIYLQRFDRDGKPLDGRGLAVAESNHHQRHPVFGYSMIAWIEEDPVTGASSVWYRAFYPTNAQAPTQLLGSPVRVADAAQGSTVSVANAHVFHALFWQDVGGRIKGARVSLIARIGYDPTPFFVSAGPADTNPEAVGNYGNTILVSWNRSHPPDACPGICFPGPHSVHATTFEVFGAPTDETEIAPPDVTEPHVVWDSRDFVIFWSDANSGDTFARRVSTTGVPVGAARFLHSGPVHDAVWDENKLFLAVEDRPRFALLSLDEDLDVIENVPFHARLAEGETMSIARFWDGDFFLAYAAQQAKAGASSRAVTRLVGENVATPRRRGVR